MSLVKIPRLMGILNLTEDSFSDGARYLSPDIAFDRACQMLEEGAELIDIGAESTRPGAKEVPENIQIQRVIPVLERLRKAYPQLSISVDTRKAGVAEYSLESGATMINDISALTHDPRMVTVLSKHADKELVLMHMQGTPETMQINPQYRDLPGELIAFFEERISLAESHAITNIYIDPGIGFGKTLYHNLSILRNIDSLKRLSKPILLGVSRKSFINKIYASDAIHRLGGSLAAIVTALDAGIDVLRVHDVQETKQFIDVWAAIRSEEEWAF